MTVLELAMIIVMAIVSMIGLSVSVYALWAMKRMADGLMRFCATGQWERPTEGSGRIFSPYKVRENDKRKGE